MVVNEGECCVSEHFGNMHHLITEVEQWWRVSSIFCQVINRSTAHNERHDKSQNGGYNLQSLRVLNVTKTEVYREESKKEESQVIWIKWQPVVKAFSIIWPKSMIYASDEAFSTTDIFQADGAIHIYRQNNHNQIFDPWSGNSISNNSNLDFLPDVKRAILVILIFGILSFRNDR